MAHSLIVYGLNRGIIHISNGGLLLDLAYRHISILLNSLQIHLVLLLRSKSIIEERSSLTGFRG